jgi:hypothetical protein
MTWQPLVRSTPYRDGKPIRLPEGQTQWMNDQYVVIRREVSGSSPDMDPMIHLSIRTQDRTPARSWRDFQRIKNQLAGPEYEGLEIYPAESRKVDTANQYHLWCFPFTFGFGLGDQRMVTNNDITQAGEPGAEQLDNEDVDGPLNTLEEMLLWKEGSMPDPDPTCSECHHRKHVHSSLGSDTPGCRVIGCDCPLTQAGVG